MGIRPRGRWSTSRKVLASLAAVALTAGVGAVAIIGRAGGFDPRPRMPSSRSVPVTEARGVAVGPDAEEALALTGAPPVAWPAPASAEVTLPVHEAKTSSAPRPVRAGTLPIYLSPAGAIATPSTVRVELLDRLAAQQAGVAGLLIRLSADPGADSSARVTPSGGAAGPVDVRLEVDYSAFRLAFGGDWASRLALASLPACGLTTPAKPQCQIRTPLPSRNDTAGARVSAVASTGSLYALAAGSSGGAGSFSPTSLGPSATWQVGLESGDFAWSYPLDLPTVPGVEPSVELSYSSGGVDGRTASTNNQPSWIGEGFSFEPGFIERSYKPCKEDGQASTLGDLCWGSYNATVSLPGVSGELVRDDATGVWRSEDDNGWRVELLSGASNGDNDGEWWRLTAPDGTAYTFGATTSSVWTVPVFGDDSTEPCHATSLATSWCQQGYRWNLESIVDRHADTVTYVYDREQNFYGRGGGAGTNTPTAYVRGGWLSRIEYGSRPGVAASARVLFATADRCVPGSACSPTTPQSWPDVPWDQQCGASTCALNSPTFWTTKRLSTITTQVYANGAFRDVDRWTLNQTYPLTGDGTSAGLWLDSIVHTGLVGGAASMPAVSFGGLQRENRVDALEGLPPMNKWRLASVTNETGGRIVVTYTPKGCTRSALPTPDTNTVRCFPAFWTPTGAADPSVDWFHKYVVSQVVEEDLVGGNRPQVTQYEYLDGAAWHHDDSELTAERYKTWGQWRGFQRVRVREGDGVDSPQSMTEHLFLRGMDGDLKANGTRRDIWVADASGNLVEDRGPWRGFARQTTVYNGASVVERSVTEPVVVATTATRARASGALEAVVSDERSQRTSLALADGSTRTTETRHSYDALGRLTQSNELGDVSVSGDESCTRITYTQNMAAWIIDNQSRVENVTVACEVTPAYPADLHSDVRYYFDGSTTWGAVPSVGDVTSADEVASWSGGPVYVTSGRMVLDQHGRAFEAFDSLGNRSSVAFTPAVGGPVTRVVTTNALGQSSSSSLDPLRGDPVVTTDPNGRRIDLAYDPLGRLTAAWGPDRSRAAGASPSVQYGYLVRANAPTVTTTRSLLASGGYLESYTLHDGFLQPRQTQAPSPAGGTILTDTFHDSHGRAAKANAPYWNADVSPSTTLRGVADAAVPSQTVNVYDGADRETAEILRSDGVEKWRSTTSYGGNWVAEDPPDGGIATTTMFDADGNIVELRQHHGGSPTGGYDATRYTYTAAGRLASVTDPAGNVRRYTYDLRGRAVRTDDPDAGAATFAFDDEDRLVSKTDARGRTVTTRYDVLGRDIGTFEGAQRLTEKSYDTLPGGIGLPTSSTRYVGDNAYVTQVSGYDVAGRSTGSTVSIPAAEVGLAGTYTSSRTYNATGGVATASLPAAGGLPAETLSFGYDAALGLPTTLTGLAEYVPDTGYDELGAVGLLTRGAPGSQVWQAFYRDPATRRVIRATTDREVESGSAVADLNYSFDPVGNLLSIADTPDGGVADVQCFDYDDRRRLTQAWTPASGDCAAQRSATSLAGPAPYWHSYTYDAVGNRLSEVRHAAGGDAVATYTYPAAGTAQPHTLRSVATTGPGVSRVDTFDYDSDGNTTTRSVGGLTQQLTWDAEGSLASATSEAGTTSFVYDADGNRLMRRDPTGVTLYLGDTELRRTASTGAVTGTRTYTHAGSVLAIRTPAGLDWMVSDQHGTATSSINAVTLSVTTRRLSPFGAPRGSVPGSWPDGRGFVGGDQDTSTGLTHLGAREYDPGIGRFISVDPIIDVQDPQQMHGYAYADNNPTTFSDPDGLKAKKKTTAKKTVKKAAKKAPTTKQKIAKAKANFNAAMKKATKAVKKALAKAEKRLQQIAKMKKESDQKKALAKLIDSLGGAIKKVVKTLATAFKKANDLLAHYGSPQMDYLAFEFGYVRDKPLKLPTINLVRKSIYHETAQRIVFGTCTCHPGALGHRYSVGEMRSTLDLAFGKGIPTASVGVTASFIVSRTGKAYVGGSVVAASKGGAVAGAKYAFVGRVSDGKVYRASDEKLDDWLPGYGGSVSASAGGKSYGVAWSFNDREYVGHEFSYARTGDIEYSVSAGGVFEIPLD